MAPVAPLLVGVAASGGAAATAGLFGAAGAFSLGTTLTTLGALAGVASAIGGAKAADAQSAARQAQLQAQADADAFNARVAEQNAEIVRGQTAAQLEKADRERRLRLGASIAAGGASGLGIDSFGDILQSSAAQEELNLLTIENEGLLRERNFLTQGNLLTSSSQNTLNQIPLVKDAGKAKSASAILSGVSSAASLIPPKGTV